MWYVNNPLILNAKMTEEMIADFCTNDESHIMKNFFRIFMMCAVMATDL